MPNSQSFRRADQNPILTRADMPFPAVAVLNPGAVDHDGHVVLLVRVEDPEGFSSIYVARSHNGVDGWDIQPEPLLEHGLPRWRYEAWGCEDARIVYIEDDGCWYITYVAYSEFGPVVALAKTEDLVSAERICLLGSTNDKDGVLFPAKFDGRYAILHRPDAGGYQHIWSGYSLDLIHWGQPHCVLREGDGPTWDGVKVGAGPPPIRTDEGWLLLYHGVKRYGGSLLYRVGAALLDLNEPYKIVARARGCIFEPEAPYEISGIVPNVVFPSGAVVRGDEIWMYYGACDQAIALATTRLQTLMDRLEPVGPDKH